jgi:hypothetical protein
MQETQRLLSEPGTGAIQSAVTVDSGEVLHFRGFDFRCLNGLFVQRRGSALRPRRRTCATSTS